MLEVDNRGMKKNLYRKIAVNMLAALVAAAVISAFFTAHLWHWNSIRQNLSQMNMWKWANRAYILAFVIFFLGLHLIFPVKEMYARLFAKRWIVGMVLLAFLTLNRYHGDSITCFDNNIQAGLSDEASQPIIGKARAIRSDEWLVTTPAILASGYGDTPYGKYNQIQRGTDTLNIITGVSVTYATLGYTPWELAYAVLPTEYAFSLCWYAPLILSFLMMMELFYLITGKKRLLSVTGALLVVCSSFYLWWGFSSYYFSAPGTVVCACYFLKSKEARKKILYGCGASICFSCFVTNLYPAWQVPLGWLFLAIGVCMLHENLDQIKGLKKKDRAILGGCVVFCVSLIAAYFLSTSEYVQSIANTVYPGERSDYGSLFLDKLFYYIQAPFYAYKDVGNPSEAGVFFNLFPIPTFMAIYCWVKEKKKDWLTGGILLVQIPMLIYITIGMPTLIGNITLFSHATVKRVSDVVGLIQVFLIIILLSRYRETKKLPMLAAGVLSVAVAGVCVHVTSKSYPDYLSLWMVIVMAVIIVLLGMGIMVSSGKKVSLYVMGGFIAVSLITGAYVRPVMKGLSAIYSKPLAAEIQKIDEENSDAKWLVSGSIICSGYTVACGASTLNSVNTYPNIELWRSLDADHKHENIYNRYAHVDVDFTSEKTSFDLVQEDWMCIHLSYSDIAKTKATEILSVHELDFEKNDYVELTEEYNESGIWIYHINYQ